ncbi:hypothetical protein ACFLRB_02545 [Acidobacteriota bacterium]
MADVRKNRDVNDEVTEKLPETSPVESKTTDADRSILEESEEILFVCREVRSHLIILTLVLIVLISLDFGGHIVSDSGFLPKPVIITIWGSLIIFALWTQLRKLKNKIILTNKKLIIRGSISYPLRCHPQNFLFFLFTCCLKK